MGWKSNKFQEFTINFLAIISLSGFLEGDQLDEMIDGKKDSFQKIAIDIWELAELGYLENQSSKLLADELSKNGFKITKGINHLSQGTNVNKSKIVIPTFNDHRMAISFSLVSMIKPNVLIQNPHCVNKTYPKYPQTTITTIDKTIATCLPNCFSFMLISKSAITPTINNKTNLFTLLSKLKFIVYN